MTEESTAIPRACRSAVWQQLYDICRKEMEENFNSENIEMQLQRPINKIIKASLEIAPYEPCQDILDFPDTYRVLLSTDNNDETSVLSEFSATHMNRTVYVFDRGADLYLI